MTIRQWKFYAEDEKGDNFYLDEDVLFVGTIGEADNEARRRSNEWEEKTGGLILRVEYESQGIVAKRLQKRKAVTGSNT